MLDCLQKSLSEQFNTHHRIVSNIIYSFYYENKFASYLKIEVHKKNLSNKKWLDIFGDQNYCFVLPIILRLL